MIHTESFWAMRNVLVGLTGLVLIVIAIARFIRNWNRGADD